VHDIKDSLQAVHLVTYLSQDLDCRRYSLYLTFAFSYSLAKGLLIATLGIFSLILVKEKY
jgi:hypothetical protein